MAKITLRLKGKNGYEKVVEEHYISGQKFLDYLVFLEEMDKLRATASPVEFFTKKVEFLASLFTSEKVTAKEIIKGLNSWELVETVDRLIEEAMGAKGEDPKLDSYLSEIAESVS